MVVERTKGVDGTEVLLVSDETGRVVYMIQCAPEYAAQAREMAFSVRAVPAAASEAPAAPTPAPADRPPLALVRASGT